MTGWLGAMARVLVIDPRSRRAVGETLLDVREELEGASAGITRVVCHVRSVAALARAVLLSLPREIRFGRIGSVLGRAAVFSLVPALAWFVATTSPVRNTADPLPMTLFDATRLHAWWFAMILAFLLPCGWFLAAARTRRGEVSRIGLAATAFVFTMLFTGWLGPAAAQHSYDLMWYRQELGWRMQQPLQGFRVLVFEHPSGTPTLLGPGGPILGAKDTREAAFVRAYTVAVPALCASLVLLATVLPSRRRVRWALAALLALGLQRLIPEMIRDTGPAWLHLPSYFPDLLVFSYAVAIAVSLHTALTLLYREARTEFESS